MSKILKYGLLALVAIIAVAVAGIAYLAATFNPNDYKANIIRAVKDGKQRTLRLDGDIKLSFYPNIGASLSKVSLSEHGSQQEFAAIDSARVSLALIPLLHRQVVVDEVAVNGLKATLVKYKDGSTNIDDLLGQAGQSSPQQGSVGGPPVKFDIKSVTVSRTHLAYRDEGSGARYDIGDLNLSTGRIAIGVPSKINLSLQLQSNQPRLNINTQLRTLLSFDLDKQKYHLQDLELKANGSAMGISDFKVQSGGDVRADLARQEFAAKKFTLNASGVKRKDKFEVALDAPSLRLTKNNYAGDKIALNARMDAAFGNIVANLSVPGIEGSAQSFRVWALSLDLGMKQPDLAYKVKLGSALSGNIKSRQFNLNDLNVALTVTGDKLPNKSVSSEMKGSVQVDALKQTVQANLAGGLLQSKIKANLGVKNFTDPAIRFDVDMDQLDADLYLPKTPASASVSKSHEPEQPLDLSGLRKLDLDGNLRIGALKALNMKASQLHVGVKAGKGVLHVNPLSARLYQGSINGSAMINAQATPELVIKQKLNGVDIAPLLKDAANLDLAEGKGNIVLDLTTQGNTVSAFKKALNGSVLVNLENGAIKGINLTKLVQGLQNLGKDTRAQTLGVDKSEKTRFTTFKASFRMHNGVAHNDDLDVRSAVLRLGGNGDIDIGHDKLNYNARAAFSKTAQGRAGTLPVNVSGPFDALKFNVDYGALLADVAKQKLDERKEQIKEDAKTRLQEKLKEGLKGLFK